MDLKVFAGSASLALGEMVAKLGNINLGRVDLQRHSDGEIWVKYLDNVRGGDIYIIQSTYQPHSNLMELLIMVDAAKRASARRVNVVIPYFGYARQDRKDQPRVSITAKLVANLITVAGADRVITMDLHAGQIQGFFDIPVDNLYGSKVFEKVTDELKATVSNITVVSTDLGSVKMARSYAKNLGAELAIIDKRRPKAGASEVMNLVGSVKDRNVVFTDDAIDTAGSLCNAVKKVKQEGALDVYGIGTHAILSGNAYEEISNSLIKKIWVTDSIPLKQPHPKIEVVSSAEILWNTILRNHKDMSISDQFVENKG